MKELTVGFIVVSIFCIISVMVYNMRVMDIMLDTQILILKNQVKILEGQL